MPLFRKDAVPISLPRRSIHYFVESVRTKFSSDTFPLLWIILLSVDCGKHVVDSNGISHISHLGLFCLHMSH